MIWKREGQFFETASVDSAIKFIEDEVETEECEDEQIIAMEIIHRE
jgi:hypothetical protein